jgi:hypothetical protein
MVGSEPSSIGNARDEGNPAQGLDLISALNALAVGERGVRLIAGEASAAEVTAFNALSERLERLALFVAEAPISLLDAELFEPTRAGENIYIAIVGVEGFNRLRRQLGSGVASSLLSSLAAVCERICLTRSHRPGRSHKRGVRLLSVRRR